MINFSLSMLPVCSQALENQMNETQSAAKVARGIVENVSVENVSKVIVGKQPVI